MIQLLLLIPAVVLIILEHRKEVKAKKFWGKEKWDAMQKDNKYKI